MTLENLRNNLIDRILITKNKKLLEAINSIMESAQSDETMSLTSEQIEMLVMSDLDIKKGNIISESELAKSDSKWIV
jgi:hypothetical protein